MSSLRSSAPASCRSRVSLRILSFPFVLLACVPATATETVTMEMESQVIDLDSGTISESAPLATAGVAGADVKLVYNADRMPHAVVFPVAAGVETAFVAGVGYDGVSSSDIPSLTFSVVPSDLPFSASDCVVVRTTQGTYFKLGNATESGLSITFNYEQL